MGPSCQWGRGRGGPLLTSAISPAGLARTIPCLRAPTWFTQALGVTVPPAVVAHLNADAVGGEVLAQSVTRLQQGLPVQPLLPLGLPGGLSAGQRELPDLEPEPYQFLHHAVESGLAAVA